MTDLKLITNFKNGDTDAFNLLVERWQQRIHRFAYRYFASHDEAMEITQKTFIKAYKKLNTLDDANKFRSWIYRIANNLCLDETRRAGRRRSAPMDTLTEHPIAEMAGANPDQVFEQQELGSILQLALNQLPPEQPAQKLLVVEPQKRSVSEWWQDAKNILPHSVPGKVGFAIAASVILLFIAGSVAETQIKTSSAGFSISLGYEPVVQEGIPAEQVQALVRQIKQENETMLAEYAEALEQKNNRQLQQVITYFEQQRLEDLKLVNRALDQYRQNTNYRLLKTNRYLGEVLQTVSNQN